MEPIRLGIIGCGIAAHELHWPALRDMKDKFRITAVCNHTEPKAKSFSETAGGVPYVLDYKDLLSREDVDAVSIILPFELNCRVAEDALMAGKHVMVEKPLASNLDDAKKMLTFGETYAPLVMMVAENFRYRPLYLRVKELLDDSAVGRVYAVVWNFFTDVGTEANRPYMSTAWRFDDIYRGGFLVDGGVHIIAALRDLFGEIISARALTLCVNPDAGRVDTMSSQFSMADGVICTVNQFYSAPGLRVNSIHIFGEDGTLLVDNDTSTITLKKRGKPDNIETTGEERGYIGEYDDFYHAIRDGNPVVSSFREAYHDLKAIFGALESADKNEIVRLN